MFTQNFIKPSAAVHKLSRLQNFEDYNKTILPALPRVVKINIGISKLHYISTHAPTNVHHQSSRVLSSDARICWSIRERSTIIQQHKSHKRTALDTTSNKQQSSDLLYKITTTTTQKPLKKDLNTPTSACCLRWLISWFFDCLFARHSQRFLITRMAQIGFQLLQTTTWANKKRGTFLLSISSPIADRFSKLFHWHTLQTISNNAIIIHPTTP